MKQIFQLVVPKGAAYIVPRFTRRAKSEKWIHRILFRLFGKPYRLVNVMELLQWHVDHAEAAKTQQ